MQKPALAGLTLVALLALVLFFFTFLPLCPVADTMGAADSLRRARTSARREARPAVAVVVDVARPVEPTAPLSADEKAARVAKIQRDYDDVRLDLMRSYGREGETFPGGSDALLRQFALLEREKHVDLARILPLPELEDLEFRDTRAGLLVQRRLAGSPVSDEQRRAVFRLQRNFDLQCGYPTDATPASFAERDRARRATEEEIRAVLGDTLFAAWLGRVETSSQSEGGG